MNASIRQTTWHNQNAWILENDTIRTVVVPSMGAKIVSLLDKRTQLEWLIGPGDRPFRPASYGAVFTEQDMSGWDEMFPTIVACPYPAPGEISGTLLPDHGEVWGLPWNLEFTTPGSLKLSVEGKALPYRLTRTLRYNAADTLEMRYELKNLGKEKLPYIWAAHPQFVCGDEAEIIFPPQVTEVCNTIPEDWGWGEPETRFDWPEAVSVNGQPVRIDHTGPSSLKAARKFYVLPETQVSWTGLIRKPSMDWICLTWNPAKVPYLGLWVDEGALNHKTVATPEPTTGFYDSLALAWEKKQVTSIDPGETQSWNLAVRLGTGDHLFPKDQLKNGEKKWK